MTNRTVSTLIALSVAASLGACGSDDGEATKPPARSTAEPAAAAPYGTYVRAVSKADIKRTAAIRDVHGPKQHTPPAGEYRLVIAKGAGQDVLKVSDPEEFTVAMDLIAEADLLRLTTYVDPAKASFCGPEIPAPARYAFEASGSELVLEPKIDDACADRDSILTGTWKKA